ncbi:hypothetical protein VD0004_g2592 [Verticillium dahliae]|uniref:Mitochondrial import inner membrane translocase subunit TIM54 n=1 Tax=Verticillium dahliae TaxID=27337 RepID=A0A444RN81_VERDA|nr:hypothetical protein VD0004_g2592 [Verticillium dahliae]PNH75406.1 hypothetical protein VD0001_g2197 [Verticillium dahliae]RXG42556.1 hypothetical protein VDGE_03511 [Verticillium dahliae]
MADAKPPVDPAPASAATPSTAPAASTSTTNNKTPGYKVPERNPALRMLGIPNLPKKLPSRNWTIFLTITTAFSAAVIYDKREKKRATARWARAVAPLATELIDNPSQLPRKLTVLLEAPPGEGLRVAQDHFIEYVKPVLAASGLDWDFVQGRQQGDVRAAVAEKIRRKRRLAERPDEELLPTEENVRDAVRAKNQIPEYQGDAGDIVIGRNTWKEYIRGLHEGWLGPLDAPVQPEPETKPEPVLSAEPVVTPVADALAETVEEAEKKAADAKAAEEKAAEEKAAEEKKKEEEKKKRPPQPPSYNSTADYAAAHLPPTLPEQLAPAAPIQFPHILGFFNTFTRLKRFLNRRALADDIGREVAAACFAAHREWREGEPGASSDDDELRLEQQRVLAHEEKNWVKSVWEEEKAPEEGKEAEPPREKVWPKPMVLDTRIASRMRRFEVQPEDEARARAIVVPEEEIEGFIKGSLRSIAQWGISAFAAENKGPNVGNLDDA